MLGSVNLFSKLKMFKLNKFFALFALFLGFYVSGIALNLNQVINQSKRLNQLEFVKENKANNTSQPLQFLEPVDEREIDEEEQIKFNTSFFTAHENTTSALLTLEAEANVFIAKVCNLNYPYKSPRFIVFHSWKYFIS
jgi:hypothetical protein